MQLRWCLTKKKVKKLFIHGYNFRAVSLWDRVGEMLVFGEKGTPEYPWRKPLGAGIAKRTNNRSQLCNSGGVWLKEKVKKLYLYTVTILEL